MKLAVLILLALLLFGCGTIPRRGVSEGGGFEKEIADADLKIETPLESGAAAPPSEDWTEVTQHPRVMIEVNEKVDKWIRYFTETERETFRIFLARGEAYREQIVKILRSAGVPEEFYYLALIESGFSVNAVSRAKAAGVWQFMRGTGTRYGLRCDRYVDERRDPFRATRAAAEYLKDLYNVFRSWRLAMAAYNAGEYRILRAIMNGNTRDFWTLAEKKALPEETMNYVPKFLAAVIVGSDPEKYGFQRVEPATTAVRAELVQVPSPIALKTIARRANIPLASLKKLNPHILGEITPPHEKEYSIWVASADVEETKRVIPRLARLKWKPARSPASRSVKYHRVKKGDRLISLAKRYGTSVAKIKRLNRLHSNRILVGTRLKLPSL